MPETSENLKAAFAGESQAFQKYMAFAAAAEGHKAKRMFRFAVAAGKVHAELYARALAASKYIQS